jgi:hypothetical protein
MGGLVRIPKKKTSSPSRDRYHLDFILQINDLLVVQELKGAASELSDDIQKLAGLLVDYTVEELKDILRRRVRDSSSIDSISAVVPAVGYTTADHELPEHLLQTIASKSGVEIKIGAGIPEAQRKTLLRALNGKTPLKD